MLWYDIFSQRYYNIFSMLWISHSMTNVIPTTQTGWKDICAYWEYGIKNMTSGEWKGTYLDDKEIIQEVREVQDLQRNSNQEFQG